MIYLNITSVLRRVDPEQDALYSERAAQCVDEIFRYHYKPELGCTLESVGPNGEFRGDVTEGRVVTPATTSSAPGSCGRRQPEGLTRSSMRWRSKSLTRPSRPAGTTSTAACSTSSTAWGVP